MERWDSRSFTSGKQVMDWKDSPLYAQYAIHIHIKETIKKIYQKNVFLLKSKSKVYKDILYSTPFYFAATNSRRKFKQKNE
jgi:hypothetical protein